MQLLFNANSSRNVNGLPLSMIAWHVVLSKSELAVELAAFNSYVFCMLHDGRMLQANIVSTARSKSSKNTMAQPDFNSIVATLCFL